MVKLKYISSLICYLLSFILICFYLILEFSIIDVVSPLNRIGIIFLIMILMYIASFLLIKTNKEKFQKLTNFNLLVWFILYLVMILNLTLFDKYFGRNGIDFYLNTNYTIKDYFKSSSNFIPFKTIHNYILALKYGNLSFSNFIYNIFGNIIAFSPLALLAPRLFTNLNKWYKYFISVSLFIFFIEILQIVMMSGSLDVDDYILNIFGSMIFYFLLNKGKVKVFLDKFINVSY